ncbi:hypothetical protein E3N88_36850 [Mikania micrantha]|uniref:Reverse transcriptase domain-containing protein n=1 Tax=Mikania micrantha TaxID=192012 RepID=A0A5N6M4T5_9ASTR|nr:hypothetical protein E3N88_36850 [Mikania micrantha]
MTTRNQEFEKALKEHELSLVRLESVAEKNSTDMATMKSQMEEILKNLQILSQSHNRKDNDSGSHVSWNPNRENVEDGRLARSNNRFSKVEFPKFDGKDVEGWIYKCEHFFTIDETPERLKVCYAAVHLEGRALQWHQSHTKVLGIPLSEINWNDYVRSIYARFASTLIEDAMGGLKALTQTGEFEVLEDYCDKFDLLLNKVNICQEYAISLFLEGLKPEIGAHVRIFRPTTLKDAYSLSRLQNHANSVSNNGLKAGNFNKGNFVSKDNSGSSTLSNANKLPLHPTPLKALPAMSTNSNKTNTGRRLSSREFDEKRAKGECFWCTDKYTPGHNCKGKQLFLFEVIEEGDTEMFQVSGNSDESVDASVDPHLSLHAITGIPSYSTMKIVGAIGTKPLQILIDSGSTHNFLNDKIADKLNCVIQSVKNMPVTIADGNQLSCVQLCKDFQWLMQGNWFKADMLVIPLSTYDIVLGIQWLQTLNDISWNFKNLTMKFTVANKCIELKGANVNIVTMCSMEKVNSIVSTPNQLIHGQLFSLKLVNNDECFQHQPKVEGIQNSKELQRLLDEFQDIFEVPKGLPPSRDCDHKIKLKDDSIQLNLKPYRYPAAQKNIIEQMTQELLDSGVIRNSTSSFAAPVVLVKKKDGSWRMCVDYRRLNTATVKDVYHIPLIEELLDELGGATMLSKLDLRSGYHQVRMHTQDIHKTAFKTHQGHYEFLVLPFGLTNAPATFQSLMNTTFKPVLRRCTLVFFFYDILVYSRSIQQHVQDLKEVLVLMCLHSLKAKLSKCTFGGNQVEYLGHIIFEKGVSTDPGKIKAIISWPTPTTIKQLRGFLGLARYYRRFIKGFGMIDRPMTELLKKDAFKWNESAQESFQNLKTALTTPPVLALLDFSKECIIETDASAKGLGAVLMQNNHPLAFISKAPFN